MKSRRESQLFNNEFSNMDLCDEFKLQQQIRAKEKQAAGKFDIYQGGPIVKYVDNVDQKKEI